MQPAAAGMIDRAGSERTLCRSQCCLDTDMIVTLSNDLVVWLLRRCRVLFDTGDAHTLVVL